MYSDHPILSSFIHTCLLFVFFIRIITCIQKLNKIHEKKNHLYFFDKLYNIVRKREKGLKRTKKD